LQPIKNAINDGPFEIMRRDLKPWAKIAVLTVSIRAPKPSNQLALRGFQDRLRQSPVEIGDQIARVFDADGDSHQFLRNLS
jgi:hypothetical protein